MKLISRKTNIILRVVDIEKIDIRIRQGKIKLRFQKTEK